MAMEGNLNDHIRRLRKRVRILLVERYSLYGGSIGAVIAAVMVLLSPRVSALLDSRLWAASVAAGVVVGIVIGLLGRLDDLSVAIAADKRTGLKERVSTAVILERAPAPGEIEEAVITDATEHIAGLRSSQVFRHRFGRPHAVFGMAAFLLLCALIIPQLEFLQSRQKKQEVTVMRQQGAEMQKVAKDIRQKAGPKQEELRKLAAKLDKLGKQMQSGRMEKKQAMLQTRKLSEEVKAMQDRLAKENTPSKSMQQAKSEMQKASEQLAEKVAQKIAAEKKIPVSEAMKQLPSDKKLAELARKEGPLSESEKAELEKALEKYADPADGTPIPVELGEALAKLAENEDFKKAMELAKGLAEKLKQKELSPADKEMLKKQLEQLAKSLENTDLDELAKALKEDAEKLAQMSPEELQELYDKMVEQAEMAKALEQAGGT